MQILKTETPKEVRDFPAKEELNPTDVVEIFQTPLTGSYNWDYTVQDNRIKKLYELGKKLNWNVEVDVDLADLTGAHAVKEERDRLYSLARLRPLLPIGSCTKFKIEKKAN